MFIIEIVREVQGNLEPKTTYFPSSIFSSEIRGHFISTLHRHLEHISDLLQVIGNWPEFPLPEVSHISPITPHPTRLHSLPLHPQLHPHSFIPT